MITPKKKISSNIKNAIEEFKLSLPEDVLNDGFEITSRDINGECSYIHDYGVLLSKEVR